MSKVSKELEIEDAIIDDPGTLGFPGASAIRRVRVSPDTGVIDLMLLPASGEASLVLVEVKDKKNKESLAGVIGQLLMYYGGALQIGERGLGQIRRFAVDKADVARSNEKISLVKLVGKKPTGAAWSILEDGPKLSPKSIRLFVALNGKPSPKLLGAISTLREHHALRVDVVYLSSKGLRMVTT